MQTSNTIKRMCIFNLIFIWVGIPSILILCVKNRGVGGGGGFALQTKSVTHDKSYLSTVPYLHKSSYSVQLILFISYIIEKFQDDSGSVVSNSVSHL